VGVISRRLGLASIVAAGLTLLPSPSACQNEATNSGDSEKLALTGVVVDSSTGEPIHGALVQVGGSQTRAMLTGPDGKFDFEGLARGVVVVSPRKPGYSNEYELSDGHRLPPTFELDSSTAPITLKLIPEGVIFGRVTAENNEPVESLPVNFTKVSIVDGRMHRETRSFPPTNENGEFRMGELRPGTYYISVGPSENPVVQPSENQARGPQGYGMTFYPAASDTESAAPIQISPGTRAEADFSILPKPLYRVTGTVSGIAQGMSTNIVVGNGGGQQASVEAQVDSQTGLFDVRSVPSGSYEVVVFAQDKQGNVLSGSTQVNVHSNVSNVHVTVAPIISIPVEFVFNIANGAPEGHPIPASVDLVPTDYGRIDMVSSHSAEAFSNSLGSVGISDVEPGSYSVRITARGPWYVESATYGSTDLFRDAMNVASGAAPGKIEIVVRDDGAALSGTVVNDGQPAQGMVLIMPDRAPAYPQVADTDAEGNFQFSMLAPGNYRVLAFDRLDNLEYTNSQALQPFVTSGKDVTLEANGKAAIQVELVKRGD
jgi:hypothetical protein